MLERKISGGISWIGFYRHVMRCLGIRGGGEVKEILGGGIKR